MTRAEMKMKKRLSKLKDDRAKISEIVLLNGFRAPTAADLVKSERIRKNKRRRRNESLAALDALRQ